MRVALRKMTEEVYRIYMPEHEEEYARDREITDYETFGEALRVVREQHKALLTHGLKTPNHYFFTIEDEERNEGVGYLWFKHHPGSREVFLYHILIREPERRKGYAREALQLLDRKAKELGGSIIWLNVMAHNPAARELYLSQGYKVAAMHMNKRLDG